MPAIRVVSYRNSTSNHNSTAIVTITNSVVSYRNSTSNHNHPRLRMRPACCILSKFYIKPQPRGLHEFPCRRCILSKFYIKPQLRRLQPVCLIVVSYRNSTSNHNEKPIMFTIKRLYLIEILHQTTTHSVASFFAAALYLIEILHQTTTRSMRASSGVWLYLIEILHQTTTPSVFVIPIVSCILSKFYIKPQLST